MTTHRLIRPGATLLATSFVLAVAVPGAAQEDDIASPSICAGATAGWMEDARAREAFLNAMEAVEPGAFGDFQADLLHACLAASGSETSPFAFAIGDTRAIGMVIPDATGDVEPIEEASGVEPEFLAEALDIKALIVEQDLEFDADELEATPETLDAIEAARWRAGRERAAIPHGVGLGSEGPASPIPGGRPGSAS